MPAFYTCRAIRNGLIGQVNKVDCWHYENPVDQQPLADQAPPAELDWDMWLGPLRWRPYNRRYCPGTFRWLLESGGGQIRDRGAHQFSTILWCLNADRQVSFTVEATGHGAGQGPVGLPTHDGRDVHVPGPALDADLEPTRSQGGEDRVWAGLLWRRRQPASGVGGARKWAEPAAKEFQVPPGGEVPYTPGLFDDFGMNHMGEWLHAIRTPDHLPNVDIEIAHRTATLCILGNLAYLLRRKLQWDGESQQVVGDAQANQLLSAPQRYPYCIEPLLA